MDYIALTAVNCFLKRKKKLRKLAFVSFIASIVSLLLHIYLKNAWIRTILLHFVLNSGMTLCAFGWNGKKVFLENWMVIYFVILLLGGIMEWEAGLGIPNTFFWIKAVCAAILLSIGTIYFVQKKELIKQILQVDIEHHGRKWELTGYWDSGNLLKDPYNGRPVNILQADLARQIFSELDYMRLIPYCSLGKQDGLLSVYNADKLSIYQAGERIDISPAVFGVAEAGLLEDKEYEVILQASMLEKER